MDFRERETEQKMVRVHVDISVFTENTAVGMVSGPLELAIVPQIGDVISFKADGSFEAFVGEKKLPFVGHLRITNRIVVVNQDEAVIVLEDITAATREGAERLLEMLGRHHELFVDVWE